jgi:Ca-activated chloride channel homolog
VRWFWPKLTLLAALTCCLLSCHRDDAKSAGPGSVTIKLVHGPEVRAYLGSLRESFYMSKPTLANGLEVKLDLISDLGLAAAKRIANGELKNDAWLAPSSSLIDYVNRSRINLGPNQIRCLPLFGTPVVVAVKAEQEVLMGVDPERRFSWTRLMRGAAAPEGASAFQLNFSHAQPRSSTTGLASLAQLAYLAAGHSRIEVADLKIPDVIARLKSFENSVFSYPLGESYLLSNIASGSGKQVHFALTTEQQLFQHNRQHPESTDKLVAVFPEEGVYWEDYNICTSEADWVTPAHQAALKALVDFMSAEPALKASEEIGFRPVKPETRTAAQLEYQTFGNLPPVPVSALPAISGEVLAYLLEAWPSFRRPAALILILDASGSMEGDGLEAGKEQFRRLLAQGASPDLRALMSFGSSVQLLSDFAVSPVSLIAALDTVQPIGGSAVYDSLNRAYNLLSQQKLSSYRRSVLLFTDGDDKNSEISLGSLLSTIHEKYEHYGINLVIVAIDREGANYSDLERIAQAANGILKVTPLMDMPSVFDEVARSL